MISNIFRSRVINPAYLILPGLLAFVLGACSMDDGDDIDMSELGATNSEYIVPAQPGEVQVQVYSNTTYNLTFVNDTDWASFPESQISGDGNFTVSYNANVGFPRMSAILIDAPSVGRQDTVYLKQRGAIEPKMDFKMTSQTVMGDGGRIEAELDTNIEFADMEIKVTYSNQDGVEWIHDNFAIEGGKLIMTADNNPSETSLRNARVELVYVDGWKQKIVSSLFLTQANANNLFGVEASFPEVRDLEGGKVNSDIYIEGYIISDAASLNVADCPQTTNTAIDYTVNDKTAYIQSIDGRYGFRLVAATVADNIFTRYSKVKLLLKGTSVTLDTDPNRYSITGITSDMVMTSEAGTSADLVKKEKYMGDLTDDDIYTYVTLKDCEFPIRKGSFTPINEGYSTAFNAHRISKFPLLMRDIQGNNMFLLTNTKCPYRRDGSTLPYGSGTVAGVVVHETFSRFAYEDTGDEETYGQIGRYQIRHMAREDITLAASFDNSFSGFVTEFRYYNVENGVLLPTTGTNGRITTTAAGKVIGVTSDYSYLGPVGAANIGNSNGNGVIKDDGSKLSTSTSTNSDGKGSVHTSDNSAWSLNCEWWNYDRNEGESWMLEMATTGISTNKLSLQIATMNWTVTGPRYWDIEWSTHGNIDGQWTKLYTYATHEAPVWANTALFQLPGYKNMDFPLPLDMLGKAKVYIRFKVAKNLCSDGYAYANTPITAASSNAFSYVAVRYNK
ncbi:BACON domain-containing protein [Dysgonomonas sp. 511]|uniref:BACON domain-containing protein n=1 Tax=Dysgonomonas sp. 511 TaxID=2302930 RepID=UPI0013D245ED|nr:BACON domain-containing protein [Dysgonomonas sp. 511]NDV78731.1 hypothetical protein [Dysgonomonas sp. 511]